jgi:peptidoglycan/xylan/chitin deacetylase (PgdA/CDA1 family)
MSFFDLAIRGMSGRAARACFRPLMSGRASVFMLHRIDNHCSGVEGHTIDYVRTALAALKRSGAEFVSVRKLVEAFRGDGPGPNWVALTIDDGFADQALLARAIAESGCPVTVFVISGFLDGEVWPWDDQVTYLLAKSPMRMLEVSIGEQRLMLDLSSQNARRVSICALRTALKRHSNAQIYSFLRTLSEQARVPLPREAPPPFQPMTWEQARALEQIGVEFGPHSVTHRIFSQLQCAEAKLEIEGSWARLQQELRRPLPVFAWPTGGSEHFTARDMDLASQAGLTAAFATNSDYAYAHAEARQERDFYGLCRFSLPHRIRDVLQYGSWIEHGKRLVRDLASRRQSV